MQQQNRSSTVCDLACLLHQVLCSAITFLLLGASVGASSANLVVGIAGYPWVNDPFQPGTLETI